jgi:hypothetical protein
MQSAAHAASLWNRPSVPQVCGMFPLHWRTPGTQLPAQAPLVQTNGHAEPVLVQWPAGSQVCG